MAMQVLHSPAEWLAHFGSGRAASVVTVGNFDGLHLGHLQLLRGVVERARALGAVATVVTFDPHPIRVLRPAKAAPLIATLKQRLAGLEQLGLDAALLMEFDRVLSHVSPQDFVRKILVEQLRAQVIRVGGNFRFGYRHAGDIRLLERMGRELHFEVEVVPPVVVRGVVVSSTAIRQAVREGRMSLAGRLLGRPFSLHGAIKPGTGRGRRLVVPTLNLAAEEELRPKTGVYATETIVGGHCYFSATNVGVRPTFDGTHFTVESHLFDFTQELTSGAMEVRFWKRLRDEKKFSGPAELRGQIDRDLARTRAFFARLGSAKSGNARPALPA